MYLLALIALLIGRPDDDGGTRIGEVRARAAAFVKEQLGDEGLDLSIEPGQVREVQKLPEGILSITFDPVERERLRGTVSIVARVSVGTESPMRVMIPVTIRIYAQVPVAVRRMGKHELLAPGDVQPQRKEVTSIRESLWSDPRVVRCRTRQMILAGAIVFDRMVEEVPLVEQGETITLLARNGNVTLSTQGIAKEDGWQGSGIVVQKSGSHERIRATVVGVKTAVVTE